MEIDAGRRYVLQSYVRLVLMHLLTMSLLQLLVDCCVREFEILLYLGYGKRCTALHSLCNMLLTIPLGPKLHSGYSSHVGNPPDISTIFVVGQDYATFKESKADKKRKVARTSLEHRSNPPPLSKKKSHGRGGNRTRTRRISRP